MKVKTTRSIKTIALVEELRQVILERQAYEKREKELKEHFRTKLGMQDAELHAGLEKVVSKLCSRRILDRDALIAKLGDLSRYERDSEYTEISVVPLTGAGKK